MQLSTYLLVFILASQTEAVLIKRGSEQVFGEAVDENSPKNTAAIFSRNRKHVCSGALIHPSWILTSALCVQKTQQNEMRIIIGEPFTNSSFDMATNIKNQYIYPTFDSSDLVDDIALLQLENPADGKTKVIKIANVNEDLNKKEFTIRGYGYYEPTHIEELPGNITQRNVRIIENSFCSQYPVTMTNKKLCTTEAACNGDQGAPLITADTNELVAIVSRREGSIICGFSAIPLTLYTKVVPYKDWIRSTANIDL